MDGSVILWFRNNTNVMQPDLEPFLAESPYCDVSHRVLQRALRQLVPEGPEGQDPRRTAVTLFHFVRDSVIWELGNWNKTASETLISGSGSCSNKANLLVALLRGAGIPAGFRIMDVDALYFGPIIPAEFLRARKDSSKPTKHFYSTAWLGGRWLRLDATDDLGVFRCAPYVPESRVASFDGESDAMLSLAPQKVFRDEGPLPSIDRYLGNPPKNAAGLKLSLAKACQQFVRSHAARYESAEEMHAGLDRWLWRHLPVRYGLFRLYLSLKREGRDDSGDRTAGSTPRNASPG